MRNRRTAFLVLAICLAFGKWTQAAPITIKVTGVVTSIRDLEDYPYSDTVYAGVPFSGTYTYDDATLNTSIHADMGIYQYDSPYGFNISVGGFEFRTSPTHAGQFKISISNDSTWQPYDRYIIESNQNENLSTGLIVNSIHWSLYDETHSALSSTSLQSISAEFNSMEK